jgi:hypothetical protein
MIINLDEHPDGGIWISDDRVNVFISARSGGVGEVGFHGLQPVSRNSRLLVYAGGVLRVSIRAGREIPFRCMTVDWAPGSMVTFARNGDIEYRLQVTACGRSLKLNVSGPPGETAVVVARFSFRSLFTDVHGERSWSVPVVREGELECTCRDRILLRDWMNRKGAYAGDFLIPEPWRRIIFKRKCRSGLATSEDLRPEFRGADYVLYDALTRFRIRGEGFTAAQDQEACSFSSQLSRENDWRAEVTLEFAEDATRFDALVMPLPGNPDQEIPEIDIHGHTYAGRFFSSVPGIVRSCTLRDTGMTRGTPGAYYWIWAWDNMVTAIEMLRWGDTQGAGRIIRFINAHRDAGGAIPARWTRTYLPLDTPPPGTFEFLLLLLTCHWSGEGTGAQELHDIYPFAVQRLGEAARNVQERGLEANIGFYPDLPVRFGRSESSAVAMESGSLYAFCRLLETVALERGDGRIASQASEIAGRILTSFEKTFWDEGAGFLLDSVDYHTGMPNDTYPLFSLLFMQTPLGLPLIRPHIGTMARFARRHLMTPHATRLIPAWDSRSRGEAALSSWYPHWDVYLLKLLRRGGEREGILSWLRSMERVLEKLGYVPEFIALEGLESNEADSWRHGAVSNLNCATGWYRAIVEGLFGIEFDTGGMSVVPLDLELPRMSLRHIVHRGSHWEIIVENRGGSAAEIRIDGTPLRGCTKIPAGYHDRGAHRLEITYGVRKAPPCFTEIVNAEVLRAEGDDAHADVHIRGLGTVDIAFPVERVLEVQVDGREAPFRSAAGTGYMQLPLAGEHTLSLRRGIHNSTKFHTEGMP